MQKKVIDRGAEKVDGLEFNGAMPASFEGYSFIVIDSVSDRSISREKLRDLFLQNPGICSAFFMLRRTEAHAAG